MKRPLLLLPLLFLCHCGSSKDAPHASASNVENAVEEQALPTVTLSEHAMQRLGIQTAEVEEGADAATRLVGGEVVIPPGRTLIVTAPVAGEVHFAAESLTPGQRVQRGALLIRLHALAPADRDTRARVGREVAAAEANVAALELRVSRNRELVEQRAGSNRAVEEATAARDVAVADLETAKSRASTLARAPLLSDVSMSVRAPSDGVIRVLSVAQGQVVSAGAPLFELVAVDALQVRVPVYSGDLARLDKSLDASLRRNGQRVALRTRFVAGPPTAEPDRGTVDHYLEVPPEAALAPGERVLVELPLREVTHVRHVPAASVVFDSWGGAWVYRCDGNRFTRARVDLVRRSGEHFIVSHGPEKGACIVSVGAVELFGTEFPPGH